jgi:hypothetical protein
MSDKGDKKPDTQETPPAKTRVKEGEGIADLSRTPPKPKPDPSPTPDPAKVIKKDSESDLKKSATE